MININFLKDKQGIEMSFNWIFAILAGIFILFVAIYAASKFIGTSQTAIGDMTASQILPIFDSLETGASSAITPAEINFKTDTKLFFNCNENENSPFGQETIAFSEKDFGKYSDKSDEVPINNKYIFSESILDTTSLNMFSKPFFMSYKVGDIIVIPSGSYCFYKTPNEIKQELPKLNNIVFEENDLNNCSGIKVCFTNEVGCDVIVDGMCTNFDCESSYDYGIVTKNNQQLYYTGNLLFGAIFSDSKIYECNVKRLMSRFNQLGLIYSQKIDIIQNKNCDASVKTNLLNAMDAAVNLNSSAELIPPNTLYAQIKAIDAENKGAGGCKLY